jgi:hypothetical protein
VVVETTVLQIGMTDDYPPFKRDKRAKDLYSFLSGSTKCQILSLDKKNSLQCKEFVTKLPAIGKKKINRKITYV